MPMLPHPFHAQAWGFGAHTGLSGYMVKEGEGLTSGFAPHTHTHTYLPAQLFCVNGQELMLLGSGTPPPTYLPTQLMRRS